MIQEVHGWVAVCDTCGRVIIGGEDSEPGRVTLEVYDTPDDLEDGLEAVSAASSDDRHAWCQTCFLNQYGDKIAKSAAYFKAEFMTDDPPVDHH